MEMQSSSPTAGVPAPLQTNPMSSTSRPAPAATLQPHLASLSLGHASFTPPFAPSPVPDPHPHVVPRGPESAVPSPSGADRDTPAIGRVRLSDIVPYDGAPDGVYDRAVQELSGSLTRHNAVLIELGGEDAAVLRCALESARMYFKAKELTSVCGGASGGAAHGPGFRGKTCSGVYHYCAGKTADNEDFYPPCMGDAFRSLGKAARVALCAIARHLRLRSDAFNHLLDDCPLPSNEVSSSMLVASFQTSVENGMRSVGAGKMTSIEIEKSLLTLIVSDCPGIQVRDPNNRWYLADRDVGPSHLLLLTGKSLSHVTAGLRPATSHKALVGHNSSGKSGERAALAFKLMPRRHAILDCSSIAAAGHVIPQSFVPISVNQFMEDLSSGEDAVCNHPSHAYEAQNHMIREPSLRSVLSDPLSGAFLEDAVVVSCGHSFGGYMLKKVIDMKRCLLCDSEIEMGSFIPNYALRAAALAVRDHDERRLLQSALRKRRKEAEYLDAHKRINKENGGTAYDLGSLRSKGVQYPFSVNEKVTIKGNKRTPDKFVGREAVITSQCLNGWYLLKVLDSGESVRLQYRSLQKASSLQVDANRITPLPLMLDNG